MPRTNPEARCPACLKNLDGATAVEKPDAMPKPGDLSVCAYCAVILEFNPDLTLRLAPDDVLSSLDMDIRATLERVRWAVRTARR